MYFKAFDYENGHIRKSTSVISTTRSYLESGVRRTSYYLTDEGLQYDALHDGNGK